MDRCEYCGMPLAAGCEDQSLPYNAIAGSRSNACYQRQVEALTKERDELMAQVAKYMAVAHQLEVERDEARKKLERLRVALEEWGMSITCEGYQHFGLCDAANEVFGKDGW